MCSVFRVGIGSHFVFFSLWHCARVHGLTLTLRVAMGWLNLSTSSCPLQMRFETGRRVQPERPRSSMPVIAWAPTAQPTAGRRVHWHLIQRCFQNTELITASIEKRIKALLDTVNRTIRRLFFPRRCPLYMHPQVCFMKLKISFKSKLLKGLMGIIHAASQRFTH